MSDLPERLRRLYVQTGMNYVQEAADEIERLTAERERLRRQLAEAGESIARQAATIRGLTITRPAGPRG